MPRMKNVILLDMYKKNHRYLRQIMSSIQLISSLKSLNHNNCLYHLMDELVQVQCRYTNSQ
jgi:hypothetical protein